MRMTRVKHLIAIAVILMLVLVGRLLVMQVIRAPYWEKEAKLSRTDTRTIPYQCGRIFDRDGRVLAEDRVTLELHANYRNFRRGHIIGQTYEALWLLGRAPREGLVGVEANLAAYTETLLTLPPETVRGLSMDRAKDLRFYLRELCVLPYSQSAAIQDWASESNLLFEEAFPLARQSVEARIERARHYGAMLDKLLAVGPASAYAVASEDPDSSEVVLPWLHAMEEARQSLERRIRWRAMGVALDRAFADVSDQEVRDALKEQGEASEDYLAYLMDRWKLSGSSEALRITLLGDHGAEGDSKADIAAKNDSARKELLVHLDQASPSDVHGLRRELVASVHSSRTKRLWRSVEYDVADLIVRRANEFPGLFIHHSPERAYMDNSPMHLVGTLSDYLNDVEKESYFRARDRLSELGRRFRLTPEEEKEYAELQHDFLALARHPGERVGLSGIEAAFDQVLRGERGYLRQLQGAEEGDRPRDLDFQPPVNGQDVVLSIDMGWQRKAEDALRWAYATAKSRYRSDHKVFQGSRELYDRTQESLDLVRAGFVLLDLESGETPVLATLPTYTSLEYQHDYEVIRDLNGLRGRPLRHRGLGGGYLDQETPYPGSTFKLLTAAVALQESPEYLVKPYDCNGTLHVGSTKLSCEGTHGSIRLGAAVMRSCNIYFYNLAKDLGYEKIYEAAKSLGFGAPTGIELVQLVEQDGEIAPLRTHRFVEGNVLRSPERKILPDVMRLGIGQTNVVASPLQMARFYGWLATGELLTPRLVMGGGGARPAAPPSAVPELSEVNRLRLLGAMRTVVELEGGTAYDSEYPLDFWDVVGKTGTAQVGEDGLNHAWFAAYFPAENPRYAAVVFCENVHLHGGQIAAEALHHFLSAIPLDELYGKDVAGEGR